MNTGYLQSLSQSIVTKAVNDVIRDSENEIYSFDELAGSTLAEVGFDELDLVEFIMNMEFLACVIVEDSFFELKKKKNLFTNQEELKFNKNIKFQTIANYLYNLMYSALND